MHSKSGYFSLTELIVIIALSAILAGLLLPALNNAGARGRRISCLNNQKQLGVWLGMYAADNEQIIINNYLGYGFNDTFWANLLQHQNIDIHKYALKESGKVFYCPDDRLDKWGSSPIPSYCWQRSTWLLYEQNGWKSIGDNWAEAKLHELEYKAILTDHPAYNKSAHINRLFIDGSALTFKPTPKELSSIKALAAAEYWSYWSGYMYWDALYMNN